MKNMIEEKNSQATKETKISLRQFIENNQRLITTMGVFFALTIYSTSIPIKQIALALSFLFMTCSFLIWMEVLSGITDYTSWSLHWFQIALLWAFLAFSFYWYIEYRTIWRYLLFIPLFSFISWSFMAIMKRYRLFERVLVIVPEKIRRPIHISMGIVLILISAEVAFLIMPSLNSILGRIADSFISWGKK
ncbi:MAG: hypothetical protein A2V73_06430 [candidate division Zixibacteria bacterium RBG_19FT_COMBO_42_43]|nr:MAG: hypothetical protein A2V73_06430 [candidate division Zixibacteria bacterium RBG_19FT_COMBO_42_43]